MKMFRKSLLILAAGAALTLPGLANAHRPWLLPSETMFTGNGNEWLSVDGAISTDLFYFDGGGPDWKPVVTAPDGSEVSVENRTVAKQRLIFDVPVKTKGTYKIAVVNDGVMGSYMLNGERKSFPRGTTPATLAAAIPAGATDVWQAENNSRVETFVTAGAPTTTVFKTTGKGIELVPVTHPNDVAAGEPATFRFLLDGKPGANLNVTAVPGGGRYRNDLGQIDGKTDTKGEVSLTLPAAGMYWISVNLPVVRPQGAPGGPGGSGAAAPGAGGPGGGSGGPGAGGPGAGGPGGGPRPITPPQRRASYVMTVEVQG